jgi:hypothetical protein
VAERSVDTAFEPGQHPAWIGPIDIERVMLMDIGFWQHICAEHFLGQR